MQRVQLAEQDDRFGLAVRCSPDEQGLSSVELVVGENAVPMQFGQLCELVSDTDRVRHSSRQLVAQGVHEPIALSGTGPPQLLAARPGEPERPQGRSGRSMYMRFRVVRTAPMVCTGTSTLDTMLHDLRARSGVRNS